MKALDYTVPWGRPREGTIARQREELEFEIHKRRVRQAPVKVDSSIPHSKNLAHMSVRLKKIQIMKDEKQKIAEGNRKLMQSIANIKAEPGTYALTGNDSTQILPGGSLRARRTKKSPSKTSGAGGAASGGTLHEPYRRRRIEKINRENAEMLRRLAAAKPTYSHKRFEAEHKERADYAQSISLARDRERRGRALLARRRAASPLLPGGGRPAGGGALSPPTGAGAAAGAAAYTEAGLGHGAVLRGGAGVALRTASQVRADLAALNDWAAVPETAAAGGLYRKQQGALYSRSAAQLLTVPSAAGRGTGGDLLSRRTNPGAPGSVTFEMSHVGAPPPRRGGGGGAAGRGGSASSSDRHRAIITPDSSVRFAPPGGLKAASSAGVVISSQASPGLS